jgi:hypothetical protein
MWDEAKRTKWRDCCVGLLKRELEFEVKLKSYRKRNLGGGWLGSLYYYTGSSSDQNVISGEES